MSMVWVITEPCVGTCDTACVAVCPVDCIHGPMDLAAIQAIPAAERGVKLPGVQMYINPLECIGCGLCEPQCPVNAIYPEDDVPKDWEHYKAAAAKFFEERS